VKTYLSDRAWRELQRRLTDDSVISQNVISLAIFSRENRSAYINGEKLDSNINIFIMM
jgi:hypothetical protein